MYTTCRNVVFMSKHINMVVAVGKLEKKKKKKKKKKKNVHVNNKRR